MEMNVALKRIDDHMHFEVSNHHGATAQVDGGPDRKGLRPMEMLLGALASCSAFDAVHILKKQKQEIHDFSVKVSGTRPDEGQVKPFTAIHAHFVLSGPVDPKKAEKAVTLAMEKYCSVSATLHPQVRITHSVETVKP
jgi:putative redox protein